MKERYERLLEDLKSQEKVEDLTNKLTEIKQEKWILESKEEFQKKVVKEYELKLKQLSTFNNKVFHRKIYNFSKEEYQKIIDKNKKEIAEYPERIIDLEKKQNEIKGLLGSLNKTNIPFTLTDDGLIFIDSENLESVPTKDNSTDISEKILVHSTGFLPVNNKILTSNEGRKIEGNVEITYKGFTKTIPSISKRNTVHFIENNVVGNHMYGTFPDHYIILEPIKHHMDQIADEDPSDTWTRGSVTLSKDAIILVKKDKIDDIPEDFKKNHNIIVYEGERKICVQNLLSQLGYPVFHIDLGYSGHYHSLDGYLETYLKSRNQMISFFQDRIIDSDDFSLSENDMITLYDLFKNADCFYNFMVLKGSSFLNSDVTYKLCEKYNIDFELFKFFVYFGLIKKGEVYSPISYNAMVDLVNIINDKNFDESKFNIIINEFGILKIQEALNNKEEEKIETIDKNELMKKTFEEINNFKNLSYAAELQKCINNLFSSITLNPTTSFDKDSINVITWVTKDKSDIFFKEGFNIDVTSEIKDDLRLSICLECKDLSCEEILERFKEYVKKVEKTNDKKI